MKIYVTVLLFFLSHNLYAASLQKLTQACQTKHAQACHDLGYLYDQKGKVKKAAAFYKRSCDLHHAMGCYRLAELYLVGSGVTQSDASFITYTQKACALGYKKSCSFSKTAQEAVTPAKPTSLLQKQGGTQTILKVPGLGTIQVHTTLLDKSKGIIQLKASMTNLFHQASGWLSFSFPDIRHDILLSSKSEGFDHIKSYPEGFSIFNVTDGKAMDSRYLLVEGEAKHWQKKDTKRLTLTLKVPTGISQLTLYVRGTLKYAKQLKSLPGKGLLGQQGFHNYTLTLPVRTPQKRSSILKLGISIPGTQTHTETSPISPTVLTRKDKLLLLDQLFTLSYFHRERKAFEKQLKETLFGDAKYLTYIKSYHCRPRGDRETYHCSLKLAGQASKKNVPIRWEFHVEFSAKKKMGLPRITEIHSLDLLE